MPINVIFLAKIAINNHFHIVSNKIQSYHNFFLTFSTILTIILSICYPLYFKYYIKSIRSELYHLLLYQYCYIVLQS